MSAGQWTSSNSLWASLWANSGLAEELSTDTRVPSGLRRNLAAAQDKAVADGYVTPAENGQLLAALKAALAGKEI